MAGDTSAALGPGNPVRGASPLRRLPPPVPGSAPHSRSDAPCCSTRLGVTFARRPKLAALAKISPRQPDLPVASRGEPASASASARGRSAYPRMKTRSRICGAPTAAAGMQCHSASYPNEASVPRTASSPRTSNAETFSTTTYRGRRSRTMRANSNQRPDLSPASPAPLPAKLMSWHGNPPAMTSTLQSSSPLGGNVFTSSWRRTSGQCFASTRRAKGSISTCHLHWRPDLSSPKSMPPIPANRLPNVSTFSITAPPWPRPPAPPRGGGSGSTGGKFRRPSPPSAP